MDKRKEMNDGEYPALAPSEESAIIRRFNGLMKYIHGWAKDKGWWDKAKHECACKKCGEINFVEIERNVPEQLALMHSEISEALEGYRHNDAMSDKIPEFTAMEEELADAIIRMLDTAGALKLRIGEALVAKLQYNLTRPYRHGGKKA